MNDKKKRERERNDEEKEGTVRSIFYQSNKDTSL